MTDEAAETIAVIDFETTGMGPTSGARATEVAAVLVRGGQIVGSYQSLMNGGAWIPPFIEQLTGISNAMLRQAPPSAQVMHEVFEFSRGLPLVAHNAAFDRAFWHAEAARAGLDPDPAHQFACTLLLSRRLYANAASHKLSNLARMHHLERDGRAHRALSDAELTARLLLQIVSDLNQRLAMPLAGRSIDHGLLCRLQKAHRDRLAASVGPR